MKLSRATQFAFALLVCLVAFSKPGFAQSVREASLSRASGASLGRQAQPSSQPVRAFPTVHLWAGLDLTYIGMFSPDGVFRIRSQFAEVTGHFAKEETSPASSWAEALGLREVPPTMLLSTERIIEDFEPPAHAQVIPQGHSRLGETRDRFLTYIYGHPSVLDAPKHVVTDSSQRLIISDPAAKAVHVLNPKNKTSFRIVSGKNRRLGQPHSVAVDAADNIYVADAERGMVVVFDHNGNFLRYIGYYRGEPEYARPTGIAIDPEAGYLYLADTPRNLVFVLDLNGNVLKRVGRLRDGSGATTFDEPTDIAVNHGHVFVLDGHGTSVQVLDREGNPLGSFVLSHIPNPVMNRDNGLAADHDGNIYGFCARIWRTPRFWRAWRFRWAREQ